MSVFLRLKDVRSATGLNQEAFGASLGVAGKTVARYERGELYPGIDFLEAVARTFPKEADYDWLVTGKTFSGSGRIATANATLLTELVKRLRLDEDLVMLASNGLVSGDAGWVLLLDAALEKARLQHLRSDELEVIEAYRIAATPGKAAIRMACAGIAAQAPKVAQHFHATVKQAAAGDIVNEVKSRRVRK